MIILCSYFEILFLPFESKCVKKEAQSVAVKIVDKAYCDIAESTDFEYKDFATVNYFESSVNSIELNSVNLNKFKSQLLLNIQEELDIQNVYTFSIPLGAFTNINEFAGIGPDVELNFRLAGTVDCEFKSEFTGDGVNQTLHKISAIINVNMNTISAEYSNNIKYKTEYVIAQTVIVGNVPNEYLNINK